MKKIFFLLIIAHYNVIASDFDSFCKALALVESNGNPKAFNKKELAKGIYQIRPDYFKDAQEADRELLKYKHSDCFNPQVAKRVIYVYFARYQPQALKNGNWEVLARAHNGGPDGAKKSATVGYWRKVSEHL